MDTKENRTFTHAKRENSFGFLYFFFTLCTDWLVFLKKWLSFLYSSMNNWIFIFLLASLHREIWQFFCYIYKMNQSYFLHRRYLSSILNWDWFCVNNAEWIHVCKLRSTIQAAKLKIRFQKRQIKIALKYSKVTIDIGIYKRNSYVGKGRWYLRRRAGL